MDRKSEDLAISFGKISWLERSLYSVLWDFFHEQIHKYVVDHKMSEKQIILCYLIMASTLNPSKYSYCSINKCYKIHIGQCTDDIKKNFVEN